MRLFPLSANQVVYLDEYFLVKNKFPLRKEKIAIANTLCIEPLRVNTWFCKKRKLTGYTRKKESREPHSF